MLKQITLIFSLLVIVFPALGQDSSVFPVVKQCFNPSSELVTQDGLIFQTIDTTRPTWGNQISDIWYLEEGEAEYLFRHTDPHASFITDGEQLLITLWSNTFNRALLLDRLTDAPIPLFTPPNEWFDPQWLGNGHVLFNVVTMPDEPVEVVTLRVDLDSYEMTDELASWVYAVYQFEDADSVLGSTMTYTGVAISPDEQFAILSKINPNTLLIDLSLIRLDDRSVLWQGSGGDDRMKIIWHPDSSAFVYLRMLANESGLATNEIVQVDLAGESRLITAFNLNEGDYYSSLLSGSLDGRYIGLLALNYDTVSAWDSVLHVVDLENQMVIDTCVTPITHQLLWSYDGSQFAYRMGDGWHVGDLNTFETRRLDDLSDADGFPLVWVKLGE